MVSYCSRCGSTERGVDHNVVKCLVCGGTSFVNRNLYEKISQRRAEKAMKFASELIKLRGNGKR